MSQGVAVWAEKMKIRLWLYFLLYSYCFHASKKKAFRMRAKVTLSQVQRETLTLSWPMVQLHRSLSKSETFPCLSWPQPQMIWSLFQSIFALSFVRAWTETNCFKENLTPKKHRDRFCRLSPTFWLIFKSLFTAFTLGIIMNNGKRSSSPPSQHCLYLKYLERRVTVTYNYCLLPYCEPT